MNKLKYYLITLAVCLPFFACNDSDKDYEKVPDRLFMPPFDSESTYAKNNAIFVKWYPIAGVLNYVVEISTDDFASIFKSVETTGTEVSFDGLAWATTYGIRLQARSADSATGNSKYATIAGGLKTENKPVVDIFRPIDALSGTSVTLSWGTYTSPLIKVEVYAGETLLHTVTTGLESHSLTLNELTPGTKYSVTLYTNDLDVGTKEFTTYPTGIIVIRENELLDDIVETCADGSVILLPYGQVHEFTKSWGKSVTLIGGEGGGGEQTTLRYNGSVTNTANGSLGPVKFLNLHINGWDETGTSRQGAFYMGSISNTVFESFTFENCTVHGFEYGLIFLQGTNSLVENVTIENCIMYDIATGWGQYSSILTAHRNNAGAGCGFNNITIRNSTFYNNPAGLIWSEMRNASGNILIENCTVNDMMKGDFMLVDFGDYEVLGTLTIRNNIFGRQKTGGANNAVPSGARVKGAALNPSPFIANNFTTTDYSVVEFPIPNLSGAGGASTAVFADPENGDFTVLSPAVKRAEAGDPRWLK
ncbi:MAG: DUF5123 domain-containing protein [Bacteroidales bacterium]|jgi:hypothetical protein|nr:DUF5123 domain-containing protein [Bacteroidales bacterium]